MEEVDEIEEEDEEYYPPPGFIERLDAYLAEVTSASRAIIVNLVVYFVIGLSLGILAFLNAMAVGEPEDFSDAIDKAVISFLGICFAIFLMPGFMLIVYIVQRRMVNLKRWRHAVTAVVSTPVGLNIVFFVTMAFTNSAFRFKGENTLEYSDVTGGEIGQFCFFYIIFSTVLAIAVSKGRRDPRIPYARIIR